MLRIVIIIASVGLAASLSWSLASNSIRSRGQDPPCTKYQLPTLLFIGTGHSGSTSLANLMNLHPNLSYGVRKEHRFFVCNPPGATCDHRVHQYKLGFKVNCNTKYTFDATASYYGIGVDNIPHRQVTLHHNPGLPAVKEVHNILPDVKILLNVRDPVDTMFSEGIEDVESMYKRDLSCLADSVETWLKVFPKSRFLVIRAEDVFDDMGKVANQIFSYMGLEARKFTDAELQTVGQSGRRRTARRASLALRQEYYSNPLVVQCKERLEQLTGMRFPWEGSP